MMYACLFMPCCVHVFLLVMWVLVGSFVAGVLGFGWPNAVMLCCILNLVLAANLLMFLLCWPVSESSDIQIIQSLRI